MDDLDHTIARVQMTVTYLYIGLFALCLSGLFIGFFWPTSVPDALNTLLVTVIGALVALITQQSQFWFARARAAGVPGPATPTSSPTTTEEVPRET